MTAEEVDAFLAGRRNAYLATLQPDGLPQLSPVWYHWEDGRLFFALGEHRRHLKNLRREPRATALIEHDWRLTAGFSAGAVGVMLAGGVHIEDDPARFAHYEALMEERYLGTEAHEEAFSEAVATERFFLAVLTPSRSVTWDFRKT